MQVCGDKYSVTYNSETATLTCSGVLDLRSCFKNIVYANLLNKILIIDI